jgi:hypothetical protein
MLEVRSDPLVGLSAVLLSHHRAGEGVPGLPQPFTALAGLVVQVNPLRLGIQPRP